MGVVEARPVDVATVTALAEHARGHDGVAPLSEQTLLRLRHGNAPVELVTTDGTEPGRGAVVGYLQLDPTSTPPAAELVVRPDFRRRGRGRALVEAALARTGGALAGWAHGDLPGARGLAARTGFGPDRVLHLMRRTAIGTGAASPDYPLPAGVRLRSFQPGQDDQAWLAVNARAFAAHPEQGRTTLTDLRERMAEPWFDPAGFLLAERVVGAGARLVGFHWTKVHPDGLGEVYVIGLDPDEQGSGLAKPLLAAGLDHLRTHGVPAVILYVEADNEKAVGLYENLGFTVEHDDVRYLREPSAHQASPS